MNIGMILYLGLARTFSVGDKRYNREIRTLHIVEDYSKVSETAHKAVVRVLTSVNAMGKIPARCD
jgi:hypothetical protein